MRIPDSYRRPKPKVSDRDFWIDPDPRREPGLLLSDRILFYCQKVNLVYPHDPLFVEPATYKLHAGREYLISDRPGQVESRDLETDGRVVIPPNGLIYIRFFEEVNIPHYMIARFNLRVTQVYRGLLLGTGPQVDPGFRGYLGCPIHNFTDEEKTIHFFDLLGTIDFEKTTPLGETFFPTREVNEITAEEYAAMRADITPVGGIGGLPCKIFNKRIDADFRSYLPGAESVRSSVHALHERVRAAQDEIREQAATIQFYRRIAIGGLIAILLTVLFGGIRLYTDFKGDIAARYMDLKGDIVELNKSVGRLEGTKEDKHRTSSPLGGERLQEKTPVSTEEESGAAQVESKPAK